MHALVNPTSVQEAMPRTLVPGVEGFEDSRDFVQSLARGLAVLKAFDGDHPIQNLATIAKRSGLSRAAARRLVFTLEHLGYLRPCARGYALSPRVLALGFGYLGSLNFSDLAQPVVEELAHRIGQSCSIAVLDGSSVVYVVRVPVRRVMTVALGVGARLPAVTTSMGRVLAGGLPDVALDQWLAPIQPQRFTEHSVTDKPRLRELIRLTRETGYAWVEQELEPGLCSLAVPIRNPQGQVALALNTSLVYQPGAAADARTRVLPMLQQTARTLESCLPRHMLPGVMA